MPIHGLFILLVYLLILSMLVKASHSSSELLYSALEYAIYTNRSMSSEREGYAADFPDFDVFTSLPVVASIFTAELCIIFIALSLAFRFTTIIILSFILTAEMPRRPLGVFVHAIP